MSVRELVIPFYYGSGSGSGSGTVINYGSGFIAHYSSSSGSGSASQKVTVPAVPVPQRWVERSMYRGNQLPLDTGKLVTIDHLITTRW